MCVEVVHEISVNIYRASCIQYREEGGWEGGRRGRGSTIIEEQILSNGFSHSSLYIHLIVTITALECLRRTQLLAGSYLSNMMVVFC